MAKVAITVWFLALVVACGAPEDDAWQLAADGGADAADDEADAPRRPLHEHAGAPAFGGAAGAAGADEADDVAPLAGSGAAGGAAGAAGDEAPLAGAGGGAASGVAGAAGAAAGAGGGSSAAGAAGGAAGSAGVAGAAGSAGAPAPDKFCKINPGQVLSGRVLGCDEFTLSAFGSVRWEIPPPSGAQSASTSCFAEPRVACPSGWKCRLPKTNSRPQQDGVCL